MTASTINNRIFVTLQAFQNSLQIVLISDTIGVNNAVGVDNSGGLLNYKTLTPALIGR